ncbi:M15 family metallopeptidase [Spirochaeta lutea]|nr:M15 family metallopeptidase [Spirochaeta lutea]
MINPWELFLKYRLIIGVGFGIVLAVLVFSAGSTRWYGPGGSSDTDEFSAPEPGRGNSGSSESNDHVVSENGGVGPEEMSIPPADRLPGFNQIRILQESYPERITARGVIDEQWALKMDGTWYLWAEGRLLPQGQHKNWQEFLEIRFYSYSLDPFRVPEYSPEQTRRMMNWGGQGGVDTRIRFNGFLDSLYEVDSEDSADRLMVRIELMGKPTRVHPLLQEPLQRVQERLEALAREDQEVGTFLDSIHQIHGYNWRNIAGTLRRSYHSYGVAIDLVPYSYGGRFPYWRWALDAGIEEWWTLDESRRWQIPPQIVRIFEDEGFVWGGKWTAFDSMHFEFRPEVIQMAGPARDIGTEQPENEPVQQP